MALPEYSFTSTMPLMADDIDDAVLNWLDRYDESSIFAAAVRDAPAPTLTARNLRPANKDFYAERPEDDAALLRQIFK